MHDQGKEAVEVPDRMVDEGVDAHPEQEHEDIAEEDRQRMPHEQVGEALSRVLRSNWSRVMIGKEPMWEPRILELCL